MTRMKAMALAVGATMAMTALAVGAGPADAAKPSRAALAEKAYAQQAKAHKARLTTAKQQHRPTRKAAKIGIAGFKLPADLPIELPSGIGAGKLDLKSWRSTLNKMLKEDF